MNNIPDIVRELRDDYPAVDVTTVVFSRDFAGVGCCVIPQDRVLAIIGEIERLAELAKLQGQEISITRERDEALEDALRLARARIAYLGAACTNPKHFEANYNEFLPRIDAALALVRKACTP